MLDFDTILKLLSVHQIIHLRRCASASSSGFPANSGLKCNQFNCGTRAGCIGCAWGIGGCTGWVGGWGAHGPCEAWGGGGAGGPISAILNYILYVHLHISSLFYIILKLKLFLLYFLYYNYIILFWHAKGP